jgi:hypothetical protein
MNAIIRTFLCAAAFAAPIAVRAAEPAAGKVLLIDYDRVIEGQIERVGDRFRILQHGGQMLIPATATTLLLPDRESAFQLVKSRAKLTDPLERVRLARWCVANQLMTHAVREAEAALAIAPDDRSLKRFVEQVKTQAELAAPPSVTGPTTLAKPGAPEPAESEPAVDVNPESFSVFVTKVQPLLMNACASCHCSERGGAFKLTRTESNYGDRRATQVNLAAASAFLNRDQPSASPILSRAVSIHGDSARPPLRDRQAPAYKHLEEWARLATGKPFAPALTASPASLPGEIVAGAQPLHPEPSAKDKEPKDSPPVVVPAKATEPAPSPKTEPSDPFDPVQFNQPKEKK